MTKVEPPIYLDHAATTPIDPRVVKAMLPYLTDNFYNPSAQYLAAKAVKKDVMAARATIAYWLGSRPAEVVFTAGGTEADNLAIRGVMEQFPGKNCIVSAIEHDAVLEPAGMHNRKILPVTSDGIVDVEHLAQIIDDDTVLVSIMYANNELGTVQPIAKIAEIIQDIRAARAKNRIDTPLYLHTDACQATPYLDLHVARLGVDMMTINASKMYGPKQVGALYIRAGISLSPQIKGGGQERGLRSGTENVAGVIGMAAALELVQQDRSVEIKRLQALQNECIRQLLAANPLIQVNGSRKHRLPNNVHITIPGQDNERLMMLLDEAGILVAAGSACSASSDEPSHVLRAIGLSDADARSSLRMTMGHATTEQQIQNVVHILISSITS